MTDTLIADGDGIYDPAAYSDRLVLGLKGTLSEALCRCRHKLSYADIPVMPTMRRQRLVSRVGEQERSA
jgi:hypothetical protein